MNKYRISFWALDDLIAIVEDDKTNEEIRSEFAEKVRSRLRKNDFTMSLVDVDEEYVDGLA